ARHALKQTEGPGLFLAVCGLHVRAPGGAAPRGPGLCPLLRARVRQRTADGGRRTAGTYHGQLGYPKRTSRKRGPGAFQLPGTIVVCPDAIPLPRLGRLRVKERGYLPPTGTAGVSILSASVSEAAGHGDVAVQVEQEQRMPEQRAPAHRGPVVGVDL